MRAACSLVKTAVKISTLRFFTAIATALLTLAAPLGAQTNSIPHIEIFRPLSGLEVALSPNPAVITVGDPLSLTATFTNRGRQELLLNPRLVLNLFIESESGPAVPSYFVIGDGPRVVVNSTQFIKLPQGATWRTPVAPHDHRRYPSHYTTYEMGDRSSGRLRLRPG